ncbi:MAG: hypothetical protein Q9174_007257, partial [Haloplaca sp. 1 TL-2023]
MDLSVGPTPQNSKKREWSVLSDNNGDNDAASISRRVEKNEELERGVKKRKIVGAVDWDQKETRHPPRLEEGIPSTGMEAVDVSPARPLKSIESTCDVIKVESEEPVESISRIPPPSRLTGASSPPPSSSSPIVSDDEDDIEYNHAHDTIKAMISLMKSLRDDSETEYDSDDEDESDMVHAMVARVMCRDDYSEDDWDDSDNWGDSSNSDSSNDSSSSDDSSSSEEDLINSAFENCGGDKDVSYYYHAYHTIQAFHRLLSYGAKKSLMKEQVKMDKVKKKQSAGALKSQRKLITAVKNVVNS